MSEHVKLFNTVDSMRLLIGETLNYLWKNPETGYREWKSSKYLETEYEKLGYKLIKAGDIPGFYTDLDTGRPGPKLLVMSELDSLICFDHPEADAKTGAVHACGHNAQSAALLGAAAALKRDGALDGLSGSIRFCVVPAEELIETGYRETLRQQGIIKYYGGKIEFLHRGYFDDVDIAFMIHTSGGEHKFYIRKGNNGCVVKNMTYHGIASHAGGAPHKGVNALYAANVGIAAINSIRETFLDFDHIRVHPIITMGGTAVNAIPSEIRMESYVRGANIEAIQKVNYKINRALAASAASLGANISIGDRAGYMPLINDENLNKLAERAMKLVVTSENVNVSDSWGTACTDMGDISAVIPSIHPHCGGASGTAHGNDYYTSDVESACIDPAKAQLAMISMLLSNNAAEANMVIANKKLRYTSYEEYFKTIESLEIDKEAVIYREDGKIELDFS